ncbi:acyl-CoA dehydrogenase family protein [Saccharopolyspora sp. NPDC050389]|uniref:acyl-CoA dehydrogenase family protein n=1 Tax=Saccharopolyspora sp. NPDC050389 TaxID=3155516 RepID=UPI0033E177CB
MTDLVRRAADLRPILARNRAIGDRLRRLPDETVEALAGAGLFRALAPRRYGGGESDLRTAIDATSEVAKADPAAAWTVMILGSGAWITGLFPGAAQDEIYAAGPDVRVCTVLTPRSTARAVDGGWRLSGRWAPASGCLHSQWAMLGFPFLDGRSGVGLALVPMRDLTVEDTWFTLGMRATGSNLLVGEDVFVPAHRVLELGPAVRGERTGNRPDVPRYRAAMMPTLAAYLIAPCLGIAEAVLEHVVEQAGEKGISFTDYERQSDSTAFQLAVADAAMKIDVVRLIGHDSAAVVDGHAAAGTHPDQLARARIRLHTGHAARLCREAVDGLVSASGASALADSHPLQGYLRDIQVAVRHAVASPASNGELFGRALLGVTPNITEMI